MITQFRLEPIGKVVVEIFRKCRRRDCAMPNDTSASGVIDSAIEQTHARADYYRDTASRLREMAEAAPKGRLRDQLAEIAGQCEDIAAMLLSC